MVAAVTGADMHGRKLVMQLVSCSSHCTTLYQAFTGVSQRSALVADFMMLCPQLCKIVQDSIHLHAKPETSWYLQTDKENAKAGGLPSPRSQHSYLACPAVLLHIAYISLQFQKQRQLQVLSAICRID